MLSRGIGKVSALAKGARKSGSRLAGSSEPLVYGKYTLATGRQTAFVTQVQPVTSFPALRSDYDSLMVGLTLAEAVATALPYESEADEYLNLLMASLAFLTPDSDPVSVAVWALLKLLTLEGHAGEWGIYTDTGQPIDQTPVAFDTNQGGVVRDTANVAEHVLIWLSAYAAVSLHQCSTLSVPPAKIKSGGECLAVLVQWLEHLLERKLPSAQALVRECCAGNE